MDEAHSKRPLPRVLKWLVFLVLLPILVPLALVLIAVIVVMLLISTLRSLLLYAMIWFRWRKRDTLFVYSDSPVWKDYLQQQLFPRMGDRLVLLNWSERRTWNAASLEVMAFKNWGGQTAFNPMAIVFRPFRRARMFRYWEAFKDFKHGNASSVEALNRQLLEAMRV